jgi:ISXO2-like transposase domain/Transposase zinc-ribbon domain
MSFMTQPVAGQDFPASLAGVRAWFPDDDACLDYLSWLRWGENDFVCHICGDVTGWRTRSGYSWECGGCKSRISPTAGTIFHRTRTPLTIWFEAAWLLTTQSYGASALGLQRVLGLGSYQTAWTMLHKFRVAMVDPNRTLLDGVVEGDEVFIGGKRKAGKPGRSAKDGVSVVICLVEKRARGFGRTRLAVVPDASAASIESVLRANMAPTATLGTDAWPSWKTASKNVGLSHQWTSVAKSGAPAHVTLPAVSRVAAQLKRWLLGTMQGAVTPEHLQSYCDEFEFRFNRRRSRNRGQLFYRLMSQSVQTPPVPYSALVLIGGRKPIRPAAPTGPRKVASTLAQPDAGRPWRH